MNLTALPKPVKLLLEMKTPAREVVFQDFPIFNDSDRDWYLKVALTGDT